MPPTLSETKNKYWAKEGGQSVVMRFGWEVKAGMARGGRAGGLGARAHSICGCKSGWQQQTKLCDASLIRFIPACTSNVCWQNYYYYIRLTAFFSGQPG